MEQLSNVGFIGLGTMGFPMAENLCTKLPEGSGIYVYDVFEAAMENLFGKYPKSVVICTSPKDVAAHASLIFTMVPEGTHARAVYLNETEGVLCHDIKSRVMVDCSTIDTETSMAICDEVQHRHPTAAFYDAPVSGGTLGAESATLTFMLGCSEKDENYPLLHHVLGLMGSNIVACGGHSLGLIAKLCNNYCSSLISLATAEAMNIGMRYGIDPRLLARVFSSSTAQSTICDKWNPVPGVCPGAPSSNGYKGGFKIQLMKKDLGLAVKAAEKAGAKLQLGEAGLSSYTMASEDPRCRNLDSRVMFRYLGGQEDWQDKL